MVDFLTNKNNIKKLLDSTHVRALDDNNIWLYGDLLKWNRGWNGMGDSYSYFINVFSENKGHKGISKTLRDLPMIQKNINSISYFTFYVDKLWRPIYVGDILKGVLIQGNICDAVVKYDYHKGIYLEEFNQRYSNYNTTFQDIPNIENDISELKVVKDVTIIGNIFGVTDYYFMKHEMNSPL